MANLATIHTSTCITTSVDLVRRHLFLGFVPRFVVLAVIAAFPFGVLVEDLKVTGLEDSLKSALALLECPHGFIVLETPLLLLAPKLP